MATVVTVQQLQSVATAQKAYIDNKAEKVLEDASNASETAISNAKNLLENTISEATTSLQNKIDAIEVPGEATDAEIKSIEDLFALPTEGE